VISFDRDTGRLRLEQDYFGALLDHLDPEAEADPGMVAELRGAGVLDGDEPAEALTPALRAVLGPACQLRLTVADLSHAVFHQAWCGGATTALLLQTRGSLHELLTLPTLLVPAFLASTTRVGPRRTRAAESIEVETQVLVDLLDLDDAVRRTAYADLRAAAPALADSIATEAVWGWGVECVWPTPSGDLDVSAIQVVDSAAGTWKRVDERTLAPSSGTDLWRDLVRLLPTDEELPVEVREGVAAARA
jgi:hypothetical protein